MEVESKNPFKFKIVWRIAAVVFIGIVIIEAIILMPSYRNFERDRLNENKKISENILETTLRLGNLKKLNNIERATEESLLIGAGVYDKENQLKQSWGIEKTLLPQALKNNPPDTRKLKRLNTNSQFTHIYSRENDTSKYLLVIDRSDVGGQVSAFIYRIIGLTLIICAFVTAVTLFSLYWMIIQPLYFLRESLMKASENVKTCNENLIENDRKDEFGDVIELFNFFLTKIGTFMAELSEKEESLKTAQYANLKKNELMLNQIKHKNQANHEVARFKAMPEKNVNPVMRADGNGNLLYTNPAGHSFLDLVNAGDKNHIPKEWIPALQNSFKTNASKNTQYIKRGRKYILSIVPDPANNNANIYCTDITGVSGR